MKIKSLTLKNFKKFESESFEFNDQSELVGANGAGKTSILEAITVAYYGKLPDGRSEISKLIKNGEKVATIVVEDEDFGTFTRKIKKSGSEVIVDSQKISQSSFESQAKLVEFKYCLAAINPNYWKDLGYKERRQVMNDLTPPVDRNKIFEENYPQRLLEKFKTYTYSEVNEQIKRENGLIEQIKGSLLELDDDGLDSEIMEFNEKEFNDLEWRHISYENVAKDYEKLQEAQESVKLIEAVEETKQNKAEMLTRKKGLQNEFDDLNVVGKDGKVLSVETLRTVVKSLTNMEVAMRKLEDDYEMSESGICKTCGQKLNKDIDVKEVLRQIEELEPKITKIKNIDQSLKEYDRELDFINRELQSIQSFLDVNKIGIKEAGVVNIIKKKKEIEEAYKNADWSSDLETEYQNLKRLRDKQEGMREILEKQKLEKEEKKKVHEERMEQAKKDLKDLEILQKALSPKGVDSLVAQEKVKFILKFVSQYAAEVEIETVEPLKSTDGVKEVFNVFRGDILESKLSTGQRMTLAVAFNLAIQDMIEEKFKIDPGIIFMDNASLVTDLSKIKKICEKKQQFYCINAKNLELTIK